MKVRTRRIEGNLTARIEGRVDGSNALDLWRELRAAIGEGDHFVILDLEDLAYVSSAGLRVFMLVAKDRAIRARGMAACSLSDPVRRVFKISGCDRIIPTYASMSEALSANG